MFLDKNKRIKYVTIIIAVLLFVGSTQIIKADWTCEDAFGLCVIMRWNPYNFGELISCIQGYSFCKKYVEQFL